MKYSKRYIAFTLILAIAFLTNFYIFGLDNSQIGTFRGAYLETVVWNPLVAADVNASVIHVYIDNKEYTSENYNFYMDENRSIMVPISIIRDALNCSIHVYNGDEILVEKRDASAKMKVGETVAENSDGEVKIKSPLTVIEDEYYVSLNDLSKLLGYTYSFDIKEKSMTTSDESEIASIVPSKYDLREKGRTSTVRDQGTYGTCWSFAAISALESTMLPENTELFSVDNMTLDNSFSVTRETGGAYTMGMAYLAAWQGPIYDSDDPYADDEINETAEAAFHVQEMQIIAGKDYEGIKEAVFKYGGVQTSIYSTITSSSAENEYFNPETNAYCYIGTERSNHDVLIVGWDDTYSASNFTNEPEGDGAFICQNSWGDGFGEDGFFYISYFDTNIGTHNIVYTEIESADNYDNIYQSDLCGWVGSIGLSTAKESIYGANVFTAKNDETIKAAGIYATAPNTEYELYLVREFKNTTSFTEKIKVADGSLDKAGYYTIHFDNEINVNKGEKYAVMLRIISPKTANPIAVEYDSGESYLESLNLEDGEGYISANGRDFISAEEQRANKESCNLCIKAFSDNR